MFRCRDIYLLIRIHVTTDNVQHVNTECFKGMIFQKQYILTDFGMFCPSFLHDSTEALATVAIDRKPSQRKNQNAVLGKKIQLQMCLIYSKSFQHFNVNLIKHQIVTFKMLSPNATCGLISNFACMQSCALEFNANNFFPTHHITNNLTKRSKLHFKIQKIKEF